MWLFDDPPKVHVLFKSCYFGDRERSLTSHFSMCAIGINRRCVGALTDKLLGMGYSRECEQYRR